MSTYRRRERRHCRVCQAPRPTVCGPDPCLGWLPGVRYACCGHGSRSQAYLVLQDSQRDPTVLRGDRALELMRGLGGDPPVPISENNHTLNWLWPKDK